jgi:hypothetical protein
VDGRTWLRASLVPPTESPSEVCPSVPRHQQWVSCSIDHRVSLPTIGRMAPSTVGTLRASPSTGSWRHSRKTIGTGIDNWPKPATRYSCQRSELPTPGRVFRDSGGRRRERPASWHGLCPRDMSFKAKCGGRREIAIPIVGIAAPVATGVGEQRARPQQPQFRGK